MKIGLLSFQHSSNYGAILQTYALKNIIESLSNNNKVYIINRKADLNKLFIKRFYSNCKGLYYNIFEFKLQKFRRKYLITRTEIINSPDKLKVLNKYNFDAVIVGSDQVWRYEYAKDIGYNYYLDFVADSTIKISYAASFGIDEWNECSDLETTKIKKLINRFDAISVRESSGVSLCKKVFDVDSQHLLDPTIIADKSIYENLLLKSNVKESFAGTIATYILDATKEKGDIINEVSKVLNIPNKNVYLKKHSKDLFKLKSIYLKDYFYPSIQYWLKGIKESNLVITDSFHGTMFSIIFKKNFIVIGNKERGISRIQSILKTFSLENRLIFNINDLNESILIPIDYTGIDDRIEMEKIKSKMYLSKNLKISVEKL